MASPAPEISDALARARLLVLDVDGTLTDGRVRYAGEEELQTFSVRDGLGIVWLREAGVDVAWISGRGCRATERRAAELDVRELHLRVASKAAILEEVQARLGVSSAETVAMGDDLPDLDLANGAALFACPADARPELREHAALVTEAAGGDGAVRELCEAILRAKGVWTERVGRSVRAGE